MEKREYVRLRASSAVYFTMTSALSSWNSRSDSRMMSPWLIQTYKFDCGVSGRNIYDPEIDSAHLLPHLATDVRKTLFAIETESLEASVTQHLGDLSILLTIFLEDEFTLVIIVLVLSTPAILTTLYPRSHRQKLEVKFEFRGCRTFPLFCMRFDQ